MSDLFDGVKVRLGRQDYVVPPLTVRQVRRFRPVIALLNETMSREPTDDELTAIIEVVHAAVARNYPDVTAEQLEDVIDLGNLGPVLKAIVGQSGLEPAAPGETRAG